MGLLSTRVGRSAPFLIFGTLACILGRSLKVTPKRVAKKFKPRSLKGDNVKKLLSLILLAAVFFASPAFAADPIVGTWNLNVAKSKFSAGAALTAGTRVYTEANGLYTLDQKLAGADGKEISFRIQYRDGTEVKETTAGLASTDTTLGKKIDANTWDFDLKKDGKVVGHVHRVVSADGKTLTVHNTGVQVSGRVGDETLVFDKQ
jgi:hypothetical protein